MRPATTTAQARDTPTRRSGEETREHVLAIAQQLFHFEGIRATGIDTVAERAGVAPPTLYRLFTSKDGLVSAYVERCSHHYRTVLSAATAPCAGGPREQILAVFAAFDDEVRSGARRGCPFLMVLAEYPDPRHPAHIKAIAHKAWLRGLFHQLARQLAEVEPVRDHQVLAEQLALVAEGVYGSLQALGPGGPAAHGRACAQALIDAARGNAVPTNAPEGH